MDANCGWLLVHGGPAVRYRTLTELCEGAPAADVTAARAALWESPLAQAWVVRLNPSHAHNALHGSNPACLENVLGKISQLGCRAGWPALDQAVAPHLDWIATPDAMSPDHLWYGNMAAEMMAVAGYGDDPRGEDVLTRRLEALAATVATGRYDIAVDRAGYPAVPAGYGDAPLIDPALYPEGAITLPQVHDLHALAAWPAGVRRAAAPASIDAAVCYVLDPRYQTFRPGFGVMLASRHRYYGIGWSVHLTGYDGVFPGAFPAALVQQVVLMARFPAAREHAWFRAGVEHLRGFVTAEGRYAFPRAYLMERPSGYWVGGATMGLEESRRSALAIEIESTFWMALIERRAGMEAA